MTSARRPSVGHVVIQRAGQDFRDPKRRPRIRMTGRSHHRGRRDQNYRQHVPVAVSYVARVASTSTHCPVASCFFLRLRRKTMNSHEAAKKNDIARTITESTAIKCRQDCTGQNVTTCFTVSFDLSPLYVSYLYNGNGKKKKPINM